VDPNLSFLKTRAFRFLELPDENGSSGGADCHMFTGQ